MLSACSHVARANVTRVLSYLCLLCGLGPATAEAQQLFFRPENGGAAISGGVYTWNSTLTNWYTAQTGGSDTTWTTGTATLVNTAGATNYSILLEQDVTVSGFSSAGGTMLSGNGPIISATSTRTITFESGATVTAVADRPLTFGQNISLSGNFNVGAANIDAVRNIAVLNGNVYSGTATILGGALLLSNTTAATQTKVVLSGTGATLAINSGTGIVTIAQLSGTAGEVTRRSGGSSGTLRLDQATSTTFGGMLKVNAWTFRKDGVGTLVLDGTAAHDNQAMAVDAGRLFVSGSSSAATSSLNTLTVAGGATYGGVGSLGTKRVTLSAETSRLAPGMYDIDANEQLVGLLPLGSGTHVFTNGGTFDFALQVVGGSLTNSSMSMATGGGLTLGTDKTFNINFIDLGVTGLATGTHTITLFSTAAALGNYSTFESQWKLNTATLPTNWSLVDPGNEFSIDGNNIVMSFVVVPEPSTILMTLTVPVFLAWSGRSRWRRR